jgi:arylformamidase
MIDISVPLGPLTPAWPGSAGIRLTRTKTLAAGDDSNSSRLDCDVHAGTHVDAPAHFLADGAEVDALPLDVLVGPAFVASLPEAQSVSAVDLSGLHLPQGTSRLLLKTRNSGLWSAHPGEFRTDYVALTADAAQWLVDRHVQLVGVDYLSVQRYGDSARTHQVLLAAGVVIVEGLDLSRVAAGPYELICLPLRLTGAEGAPARAVLRRL